MLNDSKLLMPVLEPKEDDNIEIQGLKKALTILMQTVQQQNIFIEELRSDQVTMKDDLIQHTNYLYSLSGRVTELERYSRKLCLIFTNVETGNPMATVLSIMTNCLKMNINEFDIAACHPLQNDKKLGPIIVKFIYHHHRDFA